MAQSVKGRQLRFQRENRSSTLRWATNFANSNPMQYMLAMDTTEDIRVGGCEVALEREYIL